jgi:site-specific DNA-cytosine methylase
VNENKLILDLCGGSGAWSKFYKAAGYNVMVITLPSYNVLCTEFFDSYMVFHSGNLIDEPLTVCYKSVYGILAAPPCTEFSLVKVGSRDYDGAMQIVNACLKIKDKCNPVFWAMENPAGHLRRFIGKPQFVFQPYEFGDAWTKRTDIWGNFNHPKKTYSRYEDAPQLNLYKRPKRDKVNFIWLHKAAIKDIPQLAGYNPQTDADFRAITPPGFAKAFYEANQ